MTCWPIAGFFYSSFFAIVLAMQLTLTSAEIRQRFLDFFKKRGHAIIPSASLVTPDEKGITNPTLFNTAGMQPLVPYLLGKPHPQGKRLVNVQKCIRTVDIDDIGDKTHATFFEMLGNWSLGDYFKNEAINWSYEFLTSKEEGLGLDPNRLYVTVFEGDAVAPRDEEAANIWKEVFKKNGIDFGGDTSKSEAGRIFYMPAAQNWWEAGDNGPCGPDTEMFYDISNTFGGRTLTHTEYIKADNERTVVEVWNDVFMQYEKKDGKVVGNLPAPSVDTGAGLERLAMVIQKQDSIFATDLLGPIMAIAIPMAPEVKKRRIIADHIRASIFMISDGVIPSNTDRGYILRRLIRRAITNVQNKKIASEEVDAFVEVVAETYKTAYPEIDSKKPDIKKILKEEAAKFAEALINGSKEFDKIALRIKDKNERVSGEDAFRLFSTYGFPLELMNSLAKERGLEIDGKGFSIEFNKHQNLSRAGAEQKFKGGLADANDPQVIRYHTATHLLHQALHDVYGEADGGQKGSNITAERLRFDFTHAAKMTDEEKKKVEEIVNAKIAAALPVQNVVMSKTEAEKTGARHFFGEKYGDDVSIYFIGNDLQSAYSKEFCGGPHVKNTSELAGPEGKWKFKIQKEEAVAQGVRRIKAVLE
jgi:alanyl-tRNA synthetase